VDGEFRYPQAMLLVLLADASLPDGEQMRLPRPWALPTQPVTRASLEDRGVTAAMLRTQLGAGQVVRVRKGVFVAARSVPQDPAAWYLLRARAEQVIHPEAVISHSSAAAAWGLPSPGFDKWWDYPVAMTRTAGARPRSAGAVHHRAVLPARQVSRDEQGSRLTSPARTAVDLSADLPLPEALVILDAAARMICASLVARPRREDFGNPRLVAAAREQLADAAATKRASRLRPAIGLVEPARESVIESLSAGHFECAGLPRPLFQEPVRTAAGVFFPDCLWRAQRLIGEADGAIKYADQAAIVAEKEREQALRDAGWQIVRWLGKEIMARPQSVVERVARALDAT
jgi:hypothetical protein